jgi:hypothetical protein
MPRARFSSPHSSTFPDWERGRMWGAKENDLMHLIQTGPRFFSRLPKGSHLAEKILHIWLLQCHKNKSIILIHLMGWSRLNLLSQKRVCGGLPLTHICGFPILRLRKWGFSHRCIRHSLLFHCACSVADEFSKQTPEMKMTHR